MAMQRASMFIAFRDYVDGCKPSPGKLLPAHQVVISDWESRDFGGNVFLAPEEDSIKSRCTSSDVCHEETHLYCRNVPQNGFSISQDLRAV